MKNQLIKLLGIIVVSAIIASCDSGGGSSTSSNSTTATSTLAISSPTSYPAGHANTMPVVISNIGSTNVSDLTYSITSNTTSANITITDASRNLCRNIAASTTCKLEVNIPTASQAGSFSVNIHSSSSLVNLAKSTTPNLPIGLIELPSNTVSGISVYAPSSIIANPNGSTKVVITAIVTSANAGTFNTINLTDSHGNVLPSNVLTGNSGNGLTNLSQYAVVAFSVDIPQGADSYSFNIQTALNGNIVNQGNTQNIIKVNSIPTAILSAQPSSFNLTRNVESKSITITNTGNSSATNINYLVNNSLHLNKGNCGATLASGSSCNVIVSFDSSSQTSGTSNLLVNYNTGSSSKTVTSIVNYQDTQAISGLIITSSSGNFNFDSTTNNPASTAILTLTNSGNTDISELNIPSSIGSYFNTNTIGLNSPCTSDTILSKNETCQVNLVYNDNTVSSGSENLTIGYVYGSNKGNIISNITLPYQTTQSRANLNFSPIFKNDSNGLSFESITLTNNGDARAESLKTLLAGANSSLYTIKSTTCSSSLESGASCSYTIQFGPANTTNVVGQKTANLIVNYLPNIGTTTISTSASLNDVVKSVKSAIISESQTKYTGFVGGNGESSGSAYQVQQFDQTTTITYTVTNTGNVAAESFYLISTPQSQWRVNTNCGTLSTPITLGSKATCSFVLILDTRISGNTNYNLGNLVAHYVDQDSPSGRFESFSGIIYTNIFEPPQISFTPALQTIIPGSSGNVTATLTGGYNVPSQQLSISSSENRIHITPDTCDLGSMESTICVFKLNLESGHISFGDYSLIPNNLGNVPIPESLTITVPIETTLYKFNGEPDGSNSAASLIQGSDGDLYSTTLYGGVNNSGTVFKVSLSGIESVIYSFAGGRDGANPNASLIQGSDGNLYGTTLYGGVNNTGTVFKVSSSGVESVIYSFAGGIDGSNPHASLIQGSDGSLFGTTYTGGRNNLGTVFKVSTSGIESVIYSFTGGTDGSNPTASLIQGSDGNLYGTTYAGGRNNFGTVFKVSTSGVESVIYSFAGGADGSNPVANLIQASDGNLYGSTTYGGSDNNGTIFRVSANGTKSTIHIFAGCTTDGAKPNASLIQASDGNLYGTTTYGGSDNSGTIFEISENGTGYSIIYSFIRSWDGFFPNASLIEDSDGNLYGTNTKGGINNFGTVFKVFTGL